MPFLRGDLPEDGGLSSRRAPAERVGIGDQAMSHPSEPGRWYWKGISLIVAGGIALLGGLALTIFERAPNWVPLGGAAILVLCYAAAGFLVFRHADDT